MFRTVIQQPSTGDPIESWTITHNLGEDDVSVIMRPSSPPVGAVVSVPHQISNADANSFTLIPYVEGENGPEMVPPGYYVVQVLPVGTPT